jgi:hypothetical protein
LLHPLPAETCCFQSGVLHPLPAEASCFQSERRFEPRPVASGRTLRMAETAPSVHGLQRLLH